MREALKYKFEKIEKLLEDLLLNWISAQYRDSKQKRALGKLATVGEKYTMVKSLKTNQAKSQRGAFREVQHGNNLYKLS